MNKRSADEKLFPLHPASLFWFLLSGLFLLASLFALIITHLHSSLLPVPVLVFVMARYTKTCIVAGQKKQFTLLNGQLLFFAFLGVLLPWLYFALHYIIQGETGPGYISGDTGFYGRAAEYLLHAGKENVSLDYPGVSTITKEPYHYGDLWTIALLQKISSIHPVVTTALIVYPCYMAIFLLGLAGYFQLRFVQPTRYTFLLLLAGFTSGFYFIFPTFLSGWVLSLSLVSFPKLILVAMILAGILMALRVASWDLLLLMVCTGILFFINIGPPLLLATLVLLAWMLRKKQLRLSWVPVLVCLPALVYYYFFYRNSGSGLVSGHSAFSFHTFLRIILGGILQVLPLLPFLLLALWYARKKEWFARIRTDITLLWLLPVAGLLCWGLLYPRTNESVQFFSNVLIPATAILIMVITFDALVSGKKTVVIAAGLLFFLSVALNLKPSRERNTVSSTDWQETKSFLEKHGSGYFSNLRPPQEFTELTEKNTVVWQPQDFITYLQSPYLNISLNTPEIPVDTSSVYARQEKQILATAPFSIFIKNKAFHASLEDYAYLFIREYRIRYLTVSPALTIPPRLRPMVKDSLLLASGTRIYYLEE